MNDEISMRKLEERVAYLEREMGISFDQHMFERKVKNITGVEQYTIDTSDFNNSADLIVPIYNVKKVIHTIDQMDEYGWDIIESSEDKITISIQEGLEYNL